MIKEGEPFPKFSLSDQNGSTVTKDDLKGSKAVIYFYPKDDTSGCTAEACEFQESLSRTPADEQGARVLGVSPDDVKSHIKFAKKYGLQFSLLADTDHKLCEAVGVWAEKSMYGRKYMGVERTTFVLDEQGVVRKVYAKVKPQGHAQEVLAALP